jgi:hypothetical protein
MAVERRFYSEDHNVVADAVICRHVIEHVPYPLTLLRTIRKNVARTPGATVYFETPCLEWILSRRVVWDLFYEHCALFTARSLRFAFESSGFQVKTVKSLFGDQYLWIEAVVNDASDDTPAGGDPQVRTLAFEFADAEADLVRKWRTRVEHLAALGPVTVWGAGAKGVTFVNLIDPHALLIDCVTDLNPNKQGHFVPGSGHSIVNYTDLDRRRVRFALLMNSNYGDEVR